VVGLVVDDIRSTLRLLTIVSVCMAIGTAIFGAANPQEREGALAWALVVLVLAALLGAMWAGAERWRRARAGRATGRQLKP